MIEHLRTLSRIGVTGDLSEREARRVVFLNVIVLVLVPFIILHLPLLALYFPATRWLFVVAFLHAAGWGLTLLWMHLHKYLVARIWFCVIAASCVTLETALIGTEPRLHLGLIVCTFLMFYKFPQEQRFWMYFMIAVYSVCVLGTEVLFRDGGLIEDLPRSFVDAVYYSNTVLLLTCAVIIGTFGYVTLSNAEERLARDHAVIQDKTQQLEIANKYKSHFLASASHDLRQPLHALNLFVAQLQHEPDPVQRSRLIGRIETAVHAMNELFGALLDMTKLDAGILDAAVTELSIGQLLKRIETTFADAAREKGLRLRVVSSCAWVRSDPILLERILLNLVSNAVRYTAHGGVLIGCRRHGADLRIDVCDSGPGIPEDQRRKVFGEFYQFAAPDADRRSSLGVGLAIVDRLGQLLGHPVELDSRPGQGSRFSITVPRTTEHRGAAELANGSTALVDPAFGNLIIVIDDDPLVLDGMSGILRSWGCEVVGGDTADAVLSKAQAARRGPDLIITDYRLADGKTGIGAIASLREAFDAQIPAFLISGDTAPERLREARQGGFRLLHKPVPPMRLRAMLNQLLQAPAAAPSPAARATRLRATA